MNMLSKEELKRYARHLSLEEVGINGQAKLNSAKVLVIGAGGLGCPLLQYFTAAGVGFIGIVDHDVVDESNLQRQVLYSSGDVGQLKAIVAAEKLKAQNPFISVIPFPIRLDTTNVLELIRGYDIIIDGTDNFPTRYLIGDACVIEDKPLVFGSIYKFEGQVAVFNYQNGPSYRCLYPTPPDSGSVPNCSETGVIGILPGVVGTRMATECIKMILGIGDVLSGKLLVMDLLSNNSLIVSVQRYDANFDRTQLESDYENPCDSSPIEKQEHITAEELHKRLQKDEKITILDVREPFETEICSFAKSLLIPMGQIPQRTHEIDPLTTTIVVCHHGVRSQQVIDFLKNKGYSNLINLSGGIHDWAQRIDSSMPTY